MYELPLDEIVTVIAKKTGVDRTTITLKIQDKVQELSGLISPEGAAHVVANEMGIELLNTSEKFMKIKDIIPGLRSISFSGTISRLFPVYSFDKGDKKGKVASMVISDETGEIRLVIWNHRVEIVEEGKVKEGDALRVYNVFAKEGKYGIEVHMRDKSKMEINPEGLKPIEVERQSTQNIKMIKISEISPGSNVNFSGSIIDIFSKALYFMSCPQCKKKVDENDNCKEHGAVEPEYSFILNSVIDDGTGTIRCVFFGDKVVNFLGRSKQELIEAIKSKQNPLDVIKSRVVGSEVRIFGKSRVSNYDNKMEILVMKSEFIKPKAEARRILESF